MCRKAFTLIELLVVVAIGATLAAILFPVLALAGKIVDDTARLPKRPDAASPLPAEEIVLVHRVSRRPPARWLLSVRVSPNADSPFQPSAPAGRWALEYTP